MTKNNPFRYPSPAVALVRMALPYNKDPYPRDRTPPFFLMQARELLRKRLSVSSVLMDQGIEPLSLQDCVNLVLSADCPVLVISTDSTNIDTLIQLAQMIKEHKPSCVCIAVGYAATYCYDKLCYQGSPLDYSIRGEYQWVLVDFVAKLIQARHSINILLENGVIYSSASIRPSQVHLIDDIDDLPLVPDNLRDMRRYFNVHPVSCFRALVWGWVFTTYGCPHVCNFCTQTIRISYGQKYRLRRVASVIKDIIYLQQCGANILEFVDDNFTSHREHVFALCNKMIDEGIKIPWGTHVRIDEIDFEMLALMKRAGCVYVRCGIESGSSKIIKAMSKSKDPEAWNAKVEQFFPWAKQLGIMTIAYFILGLPKENLDDVKMTKELLFKIGPDLLKVHSFCMYPGSKAFDENGRACSNQALSQLSHHGSYAFHENAKQWQELEHDMMKCFYLRPGYICNHVKKFSGFYLFNMHSFWVLFRYFCRIVLASYFGQKSYQ